MQRTVAIVWSKSKKIAMIISSRLWRWCRFKL